MLLWFWVFVCSGKLLITASLCLDSLILRILNNIRTQPLDNVSVTVKFFSDGTSSWYEAKELNFGSWTSSFLFQAKRVQFKLETIIHPKEKSIIVFKISVKKKKIMKTAFCCLSELASLIPFSSLMNQQVAIASIIHTLSNTRTKKKVDNMWSFNSEFFLLEHKGSLCLTVTWKIWLTIKNIAVCGNSILTVTEVQSLHHCQKVVWIKTTDKYYWMHSSITYLMEALVQEAAAQ